MREFIIIDSLIFTTISICLFISKISMIDFLCRVKEVVNKIFK